MVTTALIFFRRFWPPGVLVILGCFFLSGCGSAPDLGEIAPWKTRVAARHAAISQLKAEGLATEASTGLLTRSATAKLSLEQRTLIEEENYDRERIFEALARAYGFSSSDIKSLFVQMQTSR